MRQGLKTAWLGWVLALCCVLVGCGADAGSTLPNSGNGGSTVLLNVGNSTITPTPLFPAFTVGAWVSTPSPNQGDNITVYAVVRQHPPDMTSPPTAPNGAQVDFSNVGFKEQTIPTDKSGIAAWATTADGTPAQPQLIAVTAIVGGQKVAQTYAFYTILPSQYPFPTQPPTTPTPNK